MLRAAASLSAKQYPCEWQYVPWRVLVILPGNHAYTGVDSDLKHY